MSHAQVMAAAARSLGVAAEDVVADVTARDTDDEATALTARLGKEPFILVTSASHMPRSVALFRNRGASPIPAPTDHGALGGGIGLDDFKLRPGPVSETGLAIHEYVGMLWSRLRGQI
jgi:uncharacterized SAM-binding protein YcdF (DUF218 family)